MDKFSYSLGVVLGSNLANQGINEFVAEDLAKGLADVVKGQAEVDINQANALIQEHLSQAAAKAYGPAIEAAEKFLAENGKRSEVTTLESGLQYEILQRGLGPKPKATDKVTTHYHGTLIDGTVFDSSVTRNEPASFPVNGVIKGWQEALQLMPVGSKWRLYVPHNLAYGSQQMGNVIKPFSTLIFDVELLSIN